MSEPTMFGEPAGSGSLPERILIVDDDELELALLADSIAAAGFEVTVAQNGVEALTLLERQWYPVMITDWQMPVMDGIELTQVVRQRATHDMHIMMLTMRGEHQDYERGYVSGVDDYLTKKLPDTELFARIHSAFKTLALRRSVHQAQDARNDTKVDDAQSRMVTAELEALLTGEVRRAQRYRRELAVITLAVKQGMQRLAADAVPGVAVVLTQAVRSCIDRIGRLQGREEVVFAVVLPETALTEACTIAERLVALLDGWASQRREPLRFCFGATALEEGPERMLATADSLLGAAERSRGLAGTRPRLTS